MIAAAIHTAILALEYLIERARPSQLEDLKEFETFLNQLLTNPAKSETWLRWRIDHRARFEKMNETRPVVSLLDQVLT